MTLGVERDESTARSFKGFVLHADESGEIYPVWWNKILSQVKERTKHLLVCVTYLDRTNTPPFLYPVVT